MSHPKVQAKWYLPTRVQPYPSLLPPPACTFLAILVLVVDVHGLVMRQVQCTVRLGRRLWRGTAHNLRLLVEKLLRTRRLNELGQSRSRQWSPGLGGSLLNMSGPGYKFKGVGDEDSAFEYRELSLRGTKEKVDKRSVGVLPSIDIIGRIYEHFPALRAGSEYPVMVVTTCLLSAIRSPLRRSRNNGPTQSRPMGCCQAVCVAPRERGRELPGKRGPQALLSELTTVDERGSEVLNGDCRHRRPGTFVAVINAPVSDKANPGGMSVSLLHRTWGTQSWHTMSGPNMDR